MTRISLKQLMVTTAVTLPLAAGSFGAAQAQEESCARLEALLEHDMPEGVQRTEEELQQILQQADPEQCRVVSIEIEGAMAQAQEEQGQQQQAEQEQQQTEQQAAETEAEGQLVEEEMTRIELSDEVVIEGEVYVQQTPPQVDVEGAPTEVTVQETPPDVTVREQTPEIVINEQAPTIRVEMPTPTITIEQPAPEIIVTMPPPGVDVASTRPQVQVRQGEPRVSVQQERPQVDLQLSQAEDPETSEGVRIRRGTPDQPVEAGAEPPQAEVRYVQVEPTVAYQEGEQQANVQVERAQPQIRFQSAEPRVEFTPAGEPQVQFTRSGEPQVTFRESGEQQGEQQQQAQQQPEQQPEQQQEQQQQPEQQPQPEEEPQQEGMQLQDTEVETTEDEAAQTDVQAVADPDEVQMESDAEEVAEMVGPEIEREGFVTTSVNEIDVTQLTGTEVYGVNDEELGEISDLIVNADGQVENAVIDVGGFLGLGEKPVLVPFNEVTLLTSEGGEEIRAYMSTTEEQLEAMEMYEE